MAHLFGSLALVMLVVLSGCRQPADKAAPVETAPVAASTPAPAPGLYRWQAEDPGETHEIRLTVEEGRLTGTYAGVEGSDFVAHFRTPLRDVAVADGRLRFTLGERELYAEPVGLEGDLAGRESAGFDRTPWRFEGAVEKRGLRLRCAPADECWAEEMAFDKVE